MQTVWQRSIKKNNFAGSHTAGLNNMIFPVASALSITQGRRVDYRLAFSGLELLTWLKVIEHFSKEGCVHVYNIYILSCQTDSVVINKKMH